MSVRKKVIVGGVIAALAFLWVTAEAAVIFFAVVAGSFKHEKASEVTAQFMVVALLLAFLPTAFSYLLRAAAPRMVLDFQTTHDLERLAEDVYAVLAERTLPPKTGQDANGIVAERPLIRR